MMNAFNSIQSQEEIESMKAMVFKRIKEEIKPDEAIKIAYIPLILMKITKRYTDEIIKICIKNKLNFKREVNEFRELWKLYEQRIPKIPGTTGTTLDEVTSVFVDKSNGDFSILWFSVNNELLKQYPNLSPVYQELSSYTYCLSSLLNFTLQYQEKTGKKVERIMNVPYMKYEKDLIRNIQKICDKILQPVPIDTEDMVKMATKVIENKICSIVLEVAKCKE